MSDYYTDDCFGELAQAKEDLANVYVKVVDAIQRARIGELASDEQSSDYDDGYVAGLERALDIVQTLAHGGKPAS